MNSLVSIIMPVYNAEDYVMKSVKSVLNQTYKDLELIIINDGSTDNTADLLEDITDPRVKIITITNSGPSVARNRGLREAEGEYIQFIDADDYLDKKATAYLVEQMDQHDMVITGYKTIENSKTKITHVDFLGSYSAEEVARNYLDLFDNQYIKHLWNKLYAKRLIDEHNLVFNSFLKRGEGIVFNIDYLKQVEKVRFVDEAVYNHNDDNADSITANFLPTFIDNTDAVFKTIREYQSRFLDEKEYSDRLDQLYAERMIHYITVLSASQKPGEDAAVKKEIERVVNNQSFRQAIRHYKPNNKKGSVLKVLLRFKCVTLLYKYYTFRTQH